MPGWVVERAVMVEITDTGHLTTPLTWLSITLSHHIFIGTFNSLGISSNNNTSLMEDSKENRCPFWSKSISTNPHQHHGILAGVVIIQHSKLWRQLVQMLITTFSHPNPLTRAVVRKYYSANVHQTSNIGMHFRQIKLGFELQHWAKIFLYIFYS